LFKQQQQQLNTYAWAKQMATIDHCSEYFSVTFSSAALRKYIFRHYQMHKLMNKTFKLQQQAIRFSNAQH